MTFISVAKFAKLKKVTRQTVYRWIRERKIPEEKIRRKKIVVERIEILL